MLFRSQSWVCAIDKALRRTVDPRAIREGYRKACLTIGREVAWHAPDGGRHEGLAEDVTEDGALMLRLVDGQVLALRSGQVRGRGGTYM